MERIPGSEPDDIARFYVARYEGGAAVCCCRDLPLPIRERLAALPLDTVFDDHETVERILAEYSPCQDPYIGRSCIFSQPM